MRSPSQSSTFSDYEQPLLERSFSSERSDALINILNQIISSTDDINEQLCTAEGRKNITQTSLSIAEHYINLIEKYNESLQQTESADKTYQEQYDELLLALRGITRESNTTDEDQLGTDGIRYSEYHTVDHQRLEHRLFETLHESLSTLNTSIKSTSIVEDCAYLTAYYIQQYLIQLSIEHHQKIYKANRPNDPSKDRQREAEDTGKDYVLKHYSIDNYQQWLCQITDIDADINITAIEDIPLNTKQQSRIKELARAFIRGKTPSLQLLKYTESPDNFRSAYQASIQTSLEEVIQDTSHSSRFYRCMKVLPDLIGTLPTRVSKRITEPYSRKLPQLDPIARLITAYIIKYLKCVTPDISNDIINTLRNTLPKDLILSRFGYDKNHLECDLQAHLKDLFSPNQMNHLNILLERVIPLADPKIPDIRELSSHLANNLEERYLGSLLSKRARNAFQTLPTAIQLLVEKPPEYCRNADTAVIPKVLLDSLQLTHDLSDIASHNPVTDTPVIDCLCEISDEQSSEYLPFLSTKDWITEDQITAIQQATPSFGKFSRQQTRTQASIVQLINQMECTHQMNPSDVTKQTQRITKLCPEYKSVLDTSLTALQNTHEKKTEAHQVHLAAYEELNEFHSLAQRWIQLAKAGTQQYIDNKQGQWGLKATGIARANHLLTQLNSIKIEPSNESEAFHKLQKLLTSTLTTFNSGSLGTYILEALTGDPSTESPVNSDEDTESFTTIKSKTERQCNKLDQSNQDQLGFQNGYGPSGQSTHWEMMRNSYITSGIFGKTSHYTLREQSKNHFCDRLNELDQCYRAVAVAAA
ncbi:MAG: hypothetical protein CMF55_05250 [Legionellales bacterium]|nr:hypothetical protein [Legionellales bacterium]HAG61431.1 hypothetical protein [Coxiellaceae bacterium]